VLTGTPVQNSVTDLWSVFDFLIPGYLGSWDRFKKQYLSPVEQSRKKGTSPDQLLRARAALEKLHAACLPLILRRLKSDVLPELPPKIIQDVLVDLSEE